MLCEVIRRPNDDGLVSVVSSQSIVNGSLLIVPTDNLAFIVKNGVISDPYHPGRWTINTGVGPFFVRFRNLMTSGDPGITVQVWFINTSLVNSSVGGTGEILFEEKRFNLTLHAKASYNVRFSIPNPKLFLTRMVGLHRNYFNDESLQPSLDALILPLIKKAIGSSLASQRIQDVQNDLPSIGAAANVHLSELFRSYGMDLIEVSVMSVNVPREDVDRLNELEVNYARGKMKTDLERYNLDAIYDGKLEKRTRTEFLTNTARGPARFPPQGVHPINSMVTPIVSLPIRAEEFARGLSEVMPSVSGLYGQMRSDVRQNADEPLRGRNAGTIPLPGQEIHTAQHRCPSCGRILEYGSGFCRYCGRPVE